MLQTQLKHQLDEPPNIKIHIAPPSEPTRCILGSTATAQTMSQKKADGPQIADIYIKSLYIKASATYEPKNTNDRNRFNKR